MAGGGGSRFSVFSHPGRHKKSSRVEGVGFGGIGLGKAFSCVTGTLPTHWIRVWVMVSSSECNARHAVAAYTISIEHVLFVHTAGPLNASVL